MVHLLYRLYLLLFSLASFLLQYPPSRYVYLVGTKTGKDLELDNAGDDDAEVSIPDDAENNSKEAGYATEEKADVNVMQLKEKLNKRLKANSGQGIVASTKQNREALSARELESQASYESSRSAAPDISKTRVVAMEVQQTVVSAKDAAKPKWERTGPMRQSSHVRAISRFDFQADVCKDYKETGWCGYGDSCKFMHDRGDYKTGAQLEREYEENQKRLKMSGGDDDDEEDYTIKEEDDFPFACFICKEDFTDPVVTRCNHFFCEKCALKRSDILIIILPYCLRAYYLYFFAYTMTTMYNTIAILILCLRFIVASHALGLRKIQSAFVVANKRVVLLTSLRS